MVKRKALLLLLAALFLTQPVLAAPPSPAVGVMTWAHDLLAYVAEGLGLIGGEGESSPVGFDAHPSGTAEIYPTIDPWGLKTGPDEVLGSGPEPADLDDCDAGCAQIFPGYDPGG